MVVSQLITFACIPVLFRSYTPVEFAPWAVAAAIAFLGGGVATLRYELAIVIEREYKKSSALFWLSIGLAIVISMAMGIYAVPYILNYSLSSIQIPFLHSSVIVWLLLIALTTIMQAWVLRQAAYLTLSIGQICNAVVANSVQITGAYYDGGAQWLIWGSIFGQFTIFIVLLLQIARSSLPPVSPISCGAHVWDVMSQYKKFPIFSLPFTLCSIIRERAPVLVLGIWSGQAEIGLFSQAWRILSVPAALTGSAIRPVIFHEAAKNGLVNQESKIHAILRSLVLIGAPWLALLLYAPEEIFVVALGDGWEDIGAYVIVLSIPLFLFALSNWMDRMLDVVGRQDLNLVTEIVSSVTSIGGLALALYAGHSVLEAVAFQALILALNYVAFICVTYWVAGYQKQQLFYIGVSALILVALFLAMFSMLGVRFSVLATVSIGVGVAFVVSAITIFSYVRQQK